MMVGTSSVQADQAIGPDNPRLEPPVKPIWLVVFGLLLLALGVFALLSVVTATIVSVYFVAISMVMAGSAEITLGIQSKSPRRMMTWILLGALYVAAGLFAFINPLLAAGVLTLLLGASLMAAGTMRLFLSFQMRPDSQWWWAALSAAVTVLLGIMVLAQWPASSLYILGVFLSVDLIFAGACWLMIGAATMSMDDATVTQAP